MKPLKTTKLMSNFQSHYHFKLDFQKVDQHTGGEWLIHDTKRRDTVETPVPNDKIITNVIS